MALRYMKDAAAQLDAGGTIDSVPVPTAVVGSYSSLLGEYRLLFIRCEGLLHGGVLT
jgi:hypothetical protein